jgi:hypothetical protein
MTDPLVTGARPDEPITAPTTSPSIATPTSTHPTQPDSSTSQLAADAKAEAAAVTANAAEGGKQVAHEARAQAGQVADVTRRHVSELASQATSHLSQQAGVQQGRAATGMRGLADELAAMVAGSTQNGAATDLAHSAAQRLGEVADWLESRDPQEVLDDVRRYARRNPSTFLLLAAGAGLLAGRLTRGLKDASSTQAPASVAADRPLGYTTLSAQSGAMAYADPIDDPIHRPVVVAEVDPR